ncbi:MAG: serine/threonine-protein kinase [Enhygromyxa sp.]
MFGRYVLVERIGRGAMGEVWMAIDPDLDRKLALKLLRADRLARPEDRARLDAEARAMARLSHPNVVTIHDVGSLGDQLFIAMEFVAGEALDQFIARGPHPWEEVLAIMRQAGAGLAAAHDVGLVHRDFKPANVIVGEDGRVRVLDFGLARPESSVAERDGEVVARSIAVDRSELGASRKIQGSPAYMAPEQHRGVGVDARSDLFSFCVTLFEALYGVRPFRGGNRMAVALAIIEGRISEPPADARARVPDWVHAIVVRGLASEPAQRFADMQALLAALERSPEQRRRRRRQIGGTLGGAAAVLGLALWLRPEPPRDPCEAAGDAIAQVWDAEARTRLRGQVDAVAGARPLAGQRLVEGLDRYAAVWAAASEQLCRDHRAQRLTERLQATREACLAERREALQVLVGLGDTALLEGLAARPFAAVRALGDPSDCVDRAAPSEEHPAPSEEQRAARAELELALALTEGPARSSEALTKLEDTAEGDPVRALLLGRVAARQGDRAGAEARLHEAAAATIHGEPELAVRAWIALAELELTTLEGPDAPSDARRRAASIDRAAQLIDYADALLPATELDARAELALLAGRLALLEPHAARPALLDAAIERLGEQQLRAPDLLIALLELRARLHERDDDEQAAAATRNQAQQVRLAALG